ncbi:MAG: hypothetical protein K1000chlam2_00998 [Chlamydiae bacterium]|nr:hypothetical protein [Chlamydiota bacterium]
MLPISYGKCPEKDYLDAGEEIAEDFDRGDFYKIVQKINNTFFGGGVFASKSFSSLASVKYPHPPAGNSQDIHGFVSVEISSGISWSACLGYIECIPFYGSVLAVINVIGHFLYMIKSGRSLEREVEILNALERSYDNVRRGASLNLTNKVFYEAVRYTVHRNHLIGSLVAVIPFAKPAIRLAQGALYRAPTLQHQES